MRVFTRISDLDKYLNSARQNKKTIGLVPTMGALHKGHRSLIGKCNKENDITVCSIFVNPKQFNNKKDLKKYPRNLKNDTYLLKNWNCDVAFVPLEKEIYPVQKSVISFDFGKAENILEGKYRPGHFAGVALVVSKLFNITRPNRAYFGLKDLQQCFVIERLVEELSYSIELRFQKTIREKSGLAVSSRNERLTAEQTTAAQDLYKAVKLAKAIILKSGNIKNGLTAANQILKKNKILKTEYLQAVKVKDFTLVKSMRGVKKLAICVAAYAGDVRLIDNIIIRVK